MFIGTQNKLWWCAGSNPREWAKVVAREVGVIPMANTPRLPDDVLPGQQGGQGQLTAFMTRESQLSIGRNGGIVQNVTGANVAISDHEKCEMNYYENAGRRQIWVQMHRAVGSSRWAAPVTTPVNV